MRLELVTRIKQALKDVSRTKEETRLDPFQMVIEFPFDPEIRVWCALHLAPSPEGLVICEFEEYTNTIFKDIAAAKAPPASPHIPIGVEATSEEFAKSITSSSKPLAVLGIAQQREDEPATSLDIFNAMVQAQTQIAACTSVQRILEVVVGIISELTCFHRVMFYRFDSEMNGCIDAELVNPHASTDVFRGK
jgi:light-regulated signal transduction histidine kinase (bacteriophytochrome)